MIIACFKYLETIVQSKSFTCSDLLLCGSFLQGHGTAELYCPEHIVEQENIIVVTFNYRLGALGYLDWSYFNQHLNYNNGISDQINVLRWVHQYIEHFGGDSNNVTLMGQSAGSMSIMT